MDKSNKAKTFKLNNCTKKRAVADNLSDDEEEKQKNAFANNAQILFKTIKNKFSKCKSSIYKTKQRIGSFDFKNSNLVYENNIQHEESLVVVPPPVPIRILNNETDRIDTGTSLTPPASYVDIMELLQNNHQNHNLYLNCESEIHGPSLRNHIDNLSGYGWYWGPMSQQEAEEKLSSQPDGSFLVRDSGSQTYLFTISFRCVAQTLHTRIKYVRGQYSVTDDLKYGSVQELIADGLLKSRNAVFNFSMWNVKPGIPVRLVQPVSRFTQVQTLQHLCRFVIRKYITINNIQELPLPEVLKLYLRQAHY